MAKRPEHHANQQDRARLTMTYAQLARHRRWNPATDRDALREEQAHYNAWFRQSEPAANTFAVVDAAGNYPTTYQPVVTAPAGSKRYTGNARDSN